MTTDWRQSVAITAFIPPNIVYKMAMVFSIIRLGITGIPVIVDKDSAVR